MNYNVENTLKTLEDKGVQLLDPRQVYVSPEVDLGRIYPGSVLYPGARVTGSRTLIGSGAKIGSEGPATVNNSVIGAEASIASGYVTDSTLLPCAKAGANCHFRGGTLLEEEANTAHTVGLKQTIMMYGVTMGSLINFCDALISGGLSRKVHTEVGSGFIHFNFTPWGESGDKATPSLIGTVTEGVFLDKAPIFLGGLSGIVGPKEIGFGSMTIAGQVVRKSVPEETMYSGDRASFERPFSYNSITPSEKHIQHTRKCNVDYLAQLYALKAWYTQVRLKRSSLSENKELSLVYSGALETLDECVKERIKRYKSFASQWGTDPFNDACLYEAAPEFAGSVDLKPELAYDKWVWSLTESDKSQLHDWIVSCADRIKDKL
ncbi:MAG: hypothetical protein K6E30_04460 [Lachnospiraceae bacterium]|nr:hypothetical protein [Lachnospiraceae bacterium]